MIGAGYHVNCVSGAQPFPRRSWHCVQSRPPRNLSRRIIRWPALRNQSDSRIPPCFPGPLRTGPDNHHETIGELISRQVKQERKMKSVVKLAWCMLAAVVLCLPLAATAEELPDRVILFKNVNIFDGFGPELQMGMNVLVEDNYIKQASAE